MRAIGSDGGVEFRSGDALSGCTYAGTGTSHLEKVMTDVTKVSVDASAVDIPWRCHMVMWQPWPVAD